jgi:hypothetical protein
MLRASSRDAQNLERKNLKMRIEILGLDGMSAAAEAWRLSREVEVSVEWNEIAALDCPVNEMPSALVHFKDFTILEREIIASNRIHVMWARTSFVDKPDKYRLPQEMAPFVDEASHQEFRMKMVAGKVAGLHQDEWRVHLPLMSETCFCCRIGFRDVVKMAKYFDYLASCVLSCLRPRFFAVSEAFLSLADQFTGSRKETKRIFNVMNLALFLHEGKTSEYDMVSVGGFYAMGIAMPFWLRAHFIRHRPLSIVDDLLQKVINNGDVMNLTIDAPITMEVAASKQFWNTIASKRSCWLTQSTLATDRDPWAKIIDRFGDAGPDMLPCASGVCPHAKDAQLRVEGRDPGCPCIRYLSLSKINPDPFVDRIEKALSSRPTFWSDMWNEMNGMEREIGS